MRNTKMLLQNWLTEHIVHTSADVQSAAIAALRSFSATYYVVSEKTKPAINKILDKYLGGARRDRLPCARRGYCLGLSSFPRVVLEMRPDEIFEALCQAAEASSEPDTETRQFAVRALAEFAERTEALTQVRRAALTVPRKQTDILARFDRRYWMALRSLGSRAPSIFSSKASGTTRLTNVAMSGRGFAARPCTRSSAWCKVLRHEAQATRRCSHGVERTRCWASW